MHLLKSLTLKTLFWIALTHRISDLHALCIHFHEERPYHVLAMNPAFLPNLATGAALSLDIELTIFQLESNHLYSEGST